MENNKVQVQPTDIFQNFEEDYEKSNQRISKDLEGKSEKERTAYLLNSVKNMVKKWKK